MVSYRHRYKIASRNICFLLVIINAMIFVRKVPETCTNKPVVLVDGSPWYPWVLERHGLKWSRITFGERDSIEGYFKTLKEKTKRFCNNINSRVKGIQSLTVSMKPLVLYCNHTK